MPGRNQVINESGTDAMVTRRYRVTGRVQGVFFRASTRAQAMALGMAGHAVNLDDGSVEVLASGSEAAHRQLYTWLRQGPDGAMVQSVSVEEIDGAAPPGFTTG